MNGRPSAVERRAFAGGVVVVTGAAGGFGSAMARRLLAAGCRVALWDLPGTAPEEGPDARFFPCDVTDPEACREAAAATAAAFGCIDGVVANAGVTHLSPFAETEPATYAKVMAVNFFGAVHTVQAVLPQLLARNGRIGVVSSVAGIAPLLNRTGYAASKHALHGCFDSLRSELHGTGVSVTIACPSFARTNIGASAVQSTGPDPDAARTTTGGLATPESVAAAILSGMAKRRRTVLPGAIPRLAWLLARLAPAYYERRMRARIAAA